MNDNGDLTLRIINENDLERRVEIINQNKVFETLMFDQPVNYSKTKNWFENIITENNRRDYTILNPQGEIIGFAGLNQIDWYHRKANWYIFIGQNYWGGGVKI